MIVKQKLAGWIQRFWLLRWGIRLGTRLLVARQYIGAVGVVFNERGQVLLVHHVFRVDYPWGLPGGWVDLAENPADAVRRELEEELKLKVEVKQILLCSPQGSRRIGDTPPGLGLAYYCRLILGESNLEDAANASHAYEVLALAWVDPTAIKYRLSSFQAQAIVLGKTAFDLEQRQKANTVGHK